MGCQMNKLERAKELVRQLGRTLAVRDKLMQEFNISKERANRIHAKAIRQVLNKRK